MGDAADDMTAAMEAGDTLCYFDGGEVRAVCNMELMYSNISAGVPLENCNKNQREEIAKRYDLKDARLETLMEAFDP